MDIPSQKNIKRKDERYWKYHFCDYCWWLPNGYLMHLCLSVVVLHLPHFFSLYISLFFKPWCMLLEWISHLERCLFYFILSLNPFWARAKESDIDQKFLTTYTYIYYRAVVCKCVCEMREKDWGLKKSGAAQGNIF